MLIFLALAIQYFDIRFKLVGVMTVFLSLSTAGWEFTGDEGWTTLGRTCRPAARSTAPPNSAQPRPAAAALAARTRELSTLPRSASDPSPVPLPLPVRLRLRLPLPLPLPLRLRLPLRLGPGLLDTCPRPQSRTTPPSSRRLSSSATLWAIRSR